MKKLTPEQARRINSLITWISIFHGPDVTPGMESLAAERIIALQEKTGVEYHKTEWLQTFTERETATQ